jgi:hypothetical protein
LTDSSRAASRPAVSKNSGYPARRSSAEFFLRSRLPIARIVPAVLCAAVAAFAPAAAAPAAPTGNRAVRAEQPPTLEVISAKVRGRGFAVIATHVDENKPNALRLSLYAPAGAAVDLTRKTGDKVGQGIVVAGGDVPVLLGNSLVVDDPAKYASDPVVQACSPGTHATVWLLSSHVLGQTVNVPILVDPTPPEEAALGATRLQVCLSPAQFAGPAGSKLLDVALLFDSAVTGPSGRGLFTWRSLVTNVAADGTTLDTGSTYELRAVMQLPAQLTLKGRYDAKTKEAVLTGRYLLQGKPQARADVIVQYGPLTDEVVEPVTVHVTTGKNGTFVLRKRIKTSTAFVAGIAEVVQACTAPAPPQAPAGCRNESVIPPLPVSAIVQIPRKPPHRH